MGSQIVALYFLFLCSLVTKGSCSQQIFIQTGQNLHLHVPENHKEYVIFYWEFNTNSVITLESGNKPTTGSKYRDRVEFFPQNLSLILKNVQLRDTGNYSALIVTADNKEETLASFEVRVEDPVSPVKLNLSSVFSSSESCNFTVSCTTELHSISRSFTCDTHSCEEPRPQTPGHAPSGHACSLHLYLSEQSIICNHSNHVSWTNDTRDTHQICFSDETDPGPTSTPDWIIIICAVIGVCLILGAVALVAVALCRKKARNRRRWRMAENTLYAEASPLQTPPNTQIHLEESPSSTYSTVGPHTGPAAAAAAPVQNPESLYAKVEKPSRHQS